MQKHLVTLALFWALLVVALGAYTRLTDAGLGCPDWPGCYGMLTVPQGDDIATAQQTFPNQKIEPEKAWNEMIHRYLAGLLGLLIFAIAFMGFKQADKSIRMLTLSLSLLVIFQAALGMWTVTLNLMPVIVMGHLMGGFCIFCLLVALRLKLSDGFLLSAQKVDIANIVPLTRLAAISIVILCLQIMLGGWTSANYAALVCTQLPVCHGDWVNELNFSDGFALISPTADSYEFGVLDYSARMTIHMTHRAGAVVTAIILLGFFIYLYQQNVGSKVMKTLSVIGIAFLSIQIALGISNILFTLPLAVAVSHNIVALLLLATLVSCWIFLVRVQYQCRRAYE